MKPGRTAAWHRPGQILLCASLALASQHCVGDFTIPRPAQASAAPAARVSISGDADSIGAFGATLRLTAQAYDARGTALRRSLTWISDAPEIASVDAAGVVTANGNGSAAIHAMVDGVSASATVIVWQQIAKVEVSPAVDTLQVGDWVLLTATPRDAMGAVVTRPLAFRWTVSDDFAMDLQVYPNDDSRAVASRRFPGQVTITASTEQLSGSATAN